jgi:hypothetical protein
VKNGTFVLIFLCTITSVGACSIIAPTVNFIWDLAPTSDSNQLLLKLNAYETGDKETVILDLDSRTLSVNEDNVQEVQIDDPVALSTEYSSNLQLIDDDVLWIIQQGSETILNTSFTLPKLAGYSPNVNEDSSFVSEKLNRAYVWIQMNNPMTYEDITVVGTISLNTSNSFHQYTTSTYFPSYWSGYTVFDEEQVIRVNGGTSCDDIYYLYFNETSLELIAEAWLSVLTELVFDPRSNMITVASSRYISDGVYYHHISTIEYPSLTRNSWNVSQETIDEFFGSDGLTIADLDFVLTAPMLIGAFITLVYLRKRR